MDLPAGWRDVEAKKAAALEAEVAREVSRAHALAGIRLSVIARNLGRDDALFQNLSDTSHRPVGRGFIGQMLVASAQGETVPTQTVAAHSVPRARQADSKYRRDGKHCPVCLVLLSKNSQRTRTRRSCKVCGAAPQRLKRCRRCSATAGAIWHGPKGAACTTCGLQGSPRDVVAQFEAPNT